MYLFGHLHDSFVHMPLSKIICIFSNSHMSYQVEYTLVAKYKIFSGKYKVLQHKPHKNEKVLQM